jgi:16S rRNA (uracil1498-N3)-methyltransferase
MALPCFHIDLAAFEPGARLVLPETTSRHLVQVLRMQPGNALLLTNGQGSLAEAEVEHADRKHCRVLVRLVNRVTRPGPMVTLAVSLLKNAARFEWLLEKAAELGIIEIIPLVCARSEKTAFRRDRLNNILISAMLQSQQAYQTNLSEPRRLQELVADTQYHLKYLAHCSDTRTRFSLTSVIKDNPGLNASRLILIGPEGDFTPEEIGLAADNGFVEVSLGETRLRTETAAITACVLLSRLAS